MSFIDKFLKATSVDQAVKFALLSKIWLLFSGPITLYLISLYLTPIIQGFYYTFLSLIALQVFMELGFYLVITQFASHEWANLDIDDSGSIIGNPSSLSRLISLGRLVFKWYAVASGLFIILIGTIGYYFLSNKADTSISWVAPWLTLMILSGLQLWMLPFQSILEGCNQVAKVYKFRLIQSVLSALVMWTILYFDGGLWIVVASTGSGLIVNITFFSTKYFNFFKTFFSFEPAEKILWQTEIWPMQWRLALGGIVGYFMYSLFTPIVFHYHGPVAAGKMGMTWQIVGALGPLAMAWIDTKTPIWGMLIAKKRYSELDQSFYRASGVSIAVISLGALIVGFAVYGLNYYQHPLAQRILAPFPFALFLLGMVVTHFSGCLSSYIRAHKKEPFLYVNIGSGIFTGLLLWILVSKFGSNGAGATYLLVALVSLPFTLNIFLRCRNEWHKE